MIIKKDSFLPTDDKLAHMFGALSCTIILSPYVGAVRAAMVTLVVIIFIEFAQYQILQIVRSHKTSSKTTGTAILENRVGGFSIFPVDISNPKPPWYISLLAYTIGFDLPSLHDLFYGFVGILGGLLWTLTHLKVYW